MKVDIIIPVKEINHYIYESIPKILELDYEDYEIIIFPDVFNGESFPRTRIITTGNIGPAEKRDMALRYSNADILAFLDDDAYPHPDWLKNAVRHFEDPDVAAIGGPAITPFDDPFWQKVSGAVFLSRIGGGNPERYWPADTVRTVDDWPSVNFLVRQEIFKKIGGFNSKYWPGEDTKLCLDIIKMGKKIVYDPQALVWHHRRGSLIKHLRQIGRYGLHRGFFAKKFPETSRRFKYFIPAFFVLFQVMGWVAFLMKNPNLNKIYIIGMCAYFFALIVAFCEILTKEKNVAVSLASIPYIFLTHIWYGLRFLQGFLLTKDLKSKLREKAEEL
jgi:cellulose synthase/poly-beta-1,6-N-acetylglucosamine synthase-like glycosyltransferase